MQGSERVFADPSRFATSITRSANSELGGWMPRNPLRERIYGCSCERCAAVVKLVEVHGAGLMFRLDGSGRLCELAVVAAEGAQGLPAHSVVNERRAYAKHIGAELLGPISDSPDPIHICHAIDHSNHNSKARNRINLGTAMATYKNGRYFIS